jgi:GNAT superfamily N-acetyltransferase
MLKIHQIGPELLSCYASVSIAFEVRSILRVEPQKNGLAGIALTQMPVAAPYWKDYDKEERPTDWPGQFNLQNWAFFIAGDEIHQPFGAATVAWNTPGVHMLQGRSDLAVLWDIRVNPDVRGQGIGPLLFQAAEDWARSRGCTQLKVETQNINVPACRFYVRMGCSLGGILRYAYNDPNADETMLLWYKPLQGTD